MQDRQVSSGYRCVGHGGARYRTGALRALVGAIVCILLMPEAGAGADLRQLSAAGKVRRFELKVPGESVAFQFLSIAGCRYRLTATPGSLTRPMLSIGRLEEEPFAQAEAPSSGQEAVYTWDAERDGQMQVEIRGFSAQTGDGRIRLETLGPEGEVVGPHRRFLWPVEQGARVGDLLLSEANSWELVLEAGKRYEVSATQGSAGRVRLRVLGWGGEELGDSQQAGAAWLAWPPVRFLAPAAPAPPAAAKGKPRKPAPAITLEVTALLDGGGTYGVRLRELGESETLLAPDLVPPAAVQRGPVEGQPQTFRAGPGDLGVLYVPNAPDITQVVEMLRGESWIQVGEMGLQGSARSQEHALVTWFRPYYPGTYRFRPSPMPPPSTAQLMLHDRAVLGSAPMHMGTGADPTVRARLGKAWTLVGLGVCMPGWDYLYVCVGAPEQGVAMRVRDAAGKTIATRSAGDLHISPGLGPSLRFRAPRAGVYRLEARGRPRLIVRPLLRRALN